MHTSNGTRPVVVEFLRYEDKVAALQNARRLKETNIFISEDFTEAVGQKRRDLMPVMRAARETGDIAHLSHDRPRTHPPRRQRRGEKTTNPVNE